MLGFITNRLILMHKLLKTSNLTTLKQHINKPFISSSLTKLRFDNYGTKPLITTPKRDFIVVVDQATVAYRQLLGMNRVRLEPGLRLNLPILHDLRSVDMREGSLPVKNLNGFTKDNVPVSVSGTLFYKVNNAEKACFSVQNYLRSVQSVGESTARSIIGRFDYDEIISDRNTITQKLVETIDKSIDNWGVACTRFEIQVFEPQNAAVAKQLELQMEAERRRRENELITRASINTAEGDKRTVILKSEAESESLRNLANANKYKIETEASAMRLQLEDVAKVFGNNTEYAAKYILERIRLENMNAIATGPNNKTYFVPSAGVMPTAEVVSEMFKKSS